MDEEQKVPSDDEGLEGAEEKAEAEEERLKKDIAEGLKLLADGLKEKSEESGATPKGEKNIIAFEVNALGIEVTHRVIGMANADYIVFLTLVKRTIDRMMEKRLAMMASPEIPLGKTSDDNEENCDCPACSLKRTLMGKMFEEKDDG